MSNSTSTQAIILLKAHTVLEITAHYDHSHSRLSIVHIDNREQIKTICDEVQFRGNNVILINPIEVD